MAQATQQPRSGFLRGAHLDVVAASQLRNKSEQVNQMPLITRFRAELQSKFKTYITDGFPDADIEREHLRKMSTDVILLECKTSADVLRQAPDADALLVGWAPIDDSVLSGLKRLKVVVRYGAGVDNVDVKAATRNGVMIVNIPDVFTDEVADHTLSLILSLVRRITQCDRMTKNGVWNRDFQKWARPVPRLNGCVVGIVGLGRIGRAVAIRLKGFGSKLLGYDPYLQDQDFERLGIERKRSVDELLSQSEIVTIHVPLEEATKHLIGEKELELMKKGSFLVNVARGPLIDSKALYKALTDGRLAGAALDVLEKEPPDPTDPLLKLENVIVTPHMGYYSEVASPALRVRAAEETIRVLTGQLPLNLVNPDVKTHRRAI